MIWELVYILERAFGITAVMLLVKFACEPVKTLIKSLACQRAATLNVPFMCPNVREAKQVSDLSLVSGPCEVRLVG